MKIINFRARKSGGAESARARDGVLKISIDKRRGKIESKILSTAFLEAWCEAGMKEKYEERPLIGGPVASHFAKDRLRLLAGPAGALRPAIYCAAPAAFTRVME